MSPSQATNERGRTGAAALPAPVEAVAFWLSVLLPFLALALLARGLETSLDGLFFAAVVAANGVALVVGHDYGR